jgi:hypothetical protein
MAKIGELVHMPLSFLLLTAKLRQLEQVRVDRVVGQCFWMSPSSFSRAFASMVVLYLASSSR